MSQLIAHKRLITRYYRALDLAGPAELADVVCEFHAPGAPYRAVHPINDLAGPAEIAEQLLSPLRVAIPDLQHRPYIVMAGHSRDADWVCVTGVMEGAMVRPWLGIPPTGGLINLRFGAFHRIESGRIAESIVIHDIIDLMLQAGLSPLPTRALAPSIFPPPISQDGLGRASEDPEQSADSLAQVDAMIAGLMSYDGKHLESMGQERFWSPNMLWYGPGGIGSTWGLSGFQTFHQRPFLEAFPDRVGGNHRARFADGPYVASTGWPSIRATHSAPWLGVPGASNPITMRVMDWWRCEDGMLKENWVFIDIPHVLLQSGHDVFDCLK